MRLLTALFLCGLLLLSVPALAGAMPMHDPVAAEPVGVTINGDNWARDKYAAAAAAETAGVTINGDNWARDKYAAAAAAAEAAAGELPVTVPLDEPGTPWLVYAAISAALLVAVGVFVSRMPRFHMPHGA